MKRVVLAAIVVLSLPLFAGTAAAQQVGGSVVVEAGETVDGFDATGGTVVVRGTVDGDLQAYAGSVVITESGTVTGRLRAYTGAVRIDGTVGENVVVYGGSVSLGQTGEVDGSFGAAAGDARLAGTVRGDATVGAGTTHVTSTAVITGDLNYDGDLEVAPGARVDGERRRIENLDVGPSPPSLPPGTALLYWLLADLVLAAVLLRVFPAFSHDALEGALTDPARSVGVGLLAAVGVPLALGLVAITVVGVPLALAGGALFAVGLWVAWLYGRFAVGTALLEYTDYESVALALVVGIVLVGVLARIPFVGWAVRVAVIALGLGPVALGVIERYQRAGDSSRRQDRL